MLSVLVHLSQELRPPTDIPGADREELLRLLDRRQVEISRLTVEWKGLADKLETTSSAKQEIQVGKVKIIVFVLGIKWDD